MRPRSTGIRGRLFAALLCLCLIAGGAVFAWQRTRPLPPLEVGIWYWHVPFHIPPADAEKLRSAGVHSLFVHAGTIALDGTDGDLRLLRPQQWDSPDEGFVIHLVFDFDPAVRRRFADLPNTHLADALRRIATAERQRAEQVGLRISGFQIDFDCPTRRLPKYADLLRSLHLPLTVSITALPTWLSSRDVRAVFAAVDFAVPQFYEGQVPKSLDSFATISQWKTLSAGLRAAGRTGQPFYAGVPAYGHALVFDAGGALRGVFHDASPRDLAHHPAFRLVRAFPVGADGRRAADRSTYIGEDVLDFVTSLTASNGSGPGAHILFDLPSSDLVVRHLTRLRAERPRNCRGVILFRYPEPGEMQTLSLDALVAAIRDESAPPAATPAVAVRFKTSSAPWEIIDTARAAGRTPVDLTVSAMNTGTAGVFPSPNAVMLTLIFDRPGIEEVTAAGFDTAEASFCHAGPEGTACTPASPARANAVRFTRFCLAAGETTTAGIVRLPADGPTHIRGEWSAIGTGGFAVARGAIPVFDLSSAVKDTADHETPTR